MSKDFWRAALYRSLRTVCQCAVSLIPASAVMISQVDWKLIISASILAGIVSILTSIATGLPEVDYAKNMYMTVDEPDDSEVDDEE